MAARDDRHAQIESLSIDLIVGLLGFAATILWIFSFCASRIAPFPFAEGVAELWATCVFFAVCAACCALLVAASDFFKVKQRLLGLVGVLIVCVVLYEVSYQTMATVVFAGIATAILVILFSTFFFRIPQTSTLIGIIMIIVSIGMATAAYLLADASFVFVRSLPVFAVLCLVFIVRRDNEAEFPPFVSKETSDSRYKITASSKTTMCCDGLLLGIAVYSLAERWQGGEPSYFACAVLVLLLGFVLLFNIEDKGWITEGRLLQSYLVRTAPFLILLPFVDGPWIAVCAFCLLISLFFHVTLIICALSEQIRFNQLAPFYVFGQGFLCLFGPFTVGWACCAAIATKGITGPAEILFYCAVLYLLILASAFLFRDNYPRENEEDVAPGVESQEVRPWDAAIEALGDEYELSPRQKEVFSLLARGRNAEYIKEEFVISKATAKAHIYSIYRKFDVHSQQELINLVEDYCSEPSDRRLGK